MLTNWQWLGEIVLVGGSLGVEQGHSKGVKDEDLIHLLNFIEACDAFDAFFFACKQQR